MVRSELLGNRHRGRPKRRFINERDTGGKGQRMQRRRTEDAEGQRMQKRGSEEQRVRGCREGGQRMQRRRSEDAEGQRMSLLQGCGVRGCRGSENTEEGVRGTKGQRMQSVRGWRGEGQRMQRRRSEDTEGQRMERRRSEDTEGQRMSLLQGCGVRGCLCCRAVGSEDVCVAGLWGQRMSLLQGCGVRGCLCCRAVGSEDVCVAGLWGQRVRGCLCYRAVGLEDVCVAGLWGQRMSVLQGCGVRGCLCCRAVGSEGNLEVGVSLEIRSVTQDDSGVYICSSKDQGQIRYNTAVHLTVTDPGDSPLPPHSESCWDPGFCLLPGVISAALLFTTLLLCYCKGRCSGCCCGSDIAEDGALHYSSLKHLNVPRPFGRADVRLVQEDVIYDTVNQHGNFQSK
ncbi:uncharacterized protein LOC129410086 isoform X1 [Boleophthalmus pectinirostris]|uniref:uncharacterized protein LOC129410086 isoform X1 n=1 Tax=Boleophthalmus pectinirostris TaxID=150288 RepID=UPI00242CCC95|nr:uncharacterized protein LOC129410086 isoform X1 [Boleophthalmus pectinirostris]